MVRSGVIDNRPGRGPSELIAGAYDEIVEVVKAAPWTP
jgi:hypothetical protein